MAVCITDANNDVLLLIIMVVIIMSHALNFSARSCMNKPASVM